MASRIETLKNTEDLKSGDFVLLSAGNGDFAGPRQKLRELYILPHTSHGRLIDLGHLRRDLAKEESIQFLESIAGLIKEKDATAMLLCNEESFALPWFMALKRFRRQAELSVLSSYCSLMPVYGQLLDEPFLHRIHFLGVQHALCEPSLRNPDHYPRLHQIRLGMLRKELLNAEPVLRNSDMAVLGTHSVRFSDYQAAGHAQPNGFFAEEMCAIARYAGFSDRLSLCICGPYFNHSDPQSNNAALIAQIIWHFMEGWAARCADHPDLHDDFISYRCELTHERLSLLFFKSRITERWWMEIPDLDSERILVPCNYSDYSTAASGETPELFFRTIRNL